MLIRLLVNVKVDGGQRLLAGVHDLPDAHAKKLIAAKLAVAHTPSPASKVAGSAKAAPAKKEASEK